MVELTRYRLRSMLASGLCPVWSVVLTVTILLIAGCTGSVQGGDVTPAVRPDAAGTLGVSSCPLGASVSVDRTPVGVTPLSVDLPPGTYRVDVAIDGYQPAEDQVSVDSGTQSTVSVTLTDSEAPSVWLGSVPTYVLPADGLKIVAMASDAAGVAEMRLYLDGGLVNSAEGASLRWNVDTRELCAGQHALRVEAADASGNVGAQEALFSLHVPTAAVAVPTLVPQPTVLPQPMRESVQVNWSEVVIPTYAYGDALYADPEGAGHPYPLLRQELVGPVTARTYSTLRVRNEYLELVILPELGGRIYQCTFLPTGQTLFYNNAAIKPTHWGPPDQGWWLAVGGLEFALPVDEHGYVTAEPWACDVTTLDDGSAVVSLSIHERSRDLDAQVTVTVRPGEAAFHLGLHLVNPNETARQAQFWVNAMLSPGAMSVTDALRFYCPAESVLVHSRGDQALPDAGGWMSWPLYDGRDLSRYGTLRNWLGFFAPTRTGDYAAVYDESTRVGVVRTFDGWAAKGVKFFGFGSEFSDVGAYTDDGSQYVEMWGGLTPTFWDYATLEPGAGVTWEETWYVLSDVAGVSGANQEACLWLDLRDGDLTIGIVSPDEAEWVIVVWDNGNEVARREIGVAPDAPGRLTVPVPSTGERGTLWVTIEEPDGHVLISAQVGER